jgi:Ser/Thr protein kinase RdoA (MazF antagonist)
MTDIQHVWEFRAGCHVADDIHAQPCACGTCKTKRVAAVAEQPALDDSSFVQFVGDTTHYSVRELRALEGRRHSAIDQAHLDAAGTHAAAVLDRLHSAGGRVPGVSQTAEADIERTERAAERYAAPDPYERELKQLKAAAATSESTFAERYAADRLASAMAMRAALDAEEPRLAAAELAAPPDSYAAGIEALRAKESR